METNSEFNANRASLQLFLTRLGEVSTSHLQQRIQAEKEQLAKFLPEVGRLHAPIKEARKREAPRYNIFEILKIRHYEARVHTPFLVDLLSPRGKHAQGALFYDSFVKRVLKGDELFHNCQLLDVSGEQHAGDLGRIDIWIQNNWYPHRHCIVIENKIYAKDQPQQLERYYLRARRLGFKPNQIRIFYLTVHPVPHPPVHSIRRSLWIPLETSGVFHCISYAADIIPWLKEMHKKVEAPAVRSILSQYIKTLKTL